MGSTGLTKQMSRLRIPKNPNSGMAPGGKILVYVYWKVVQSLTDKHSVQAKHFQEGCAEFLSGLRKRDTDGESYMNDTEINTSQRNGGG